MYCFLGFIRVFPRFACQRVVPVVSEDRVRKDKSSEDCLKKQGKSHIPLEHIEPIYRSQIKLHVLLITGDHGITYLLTCAMFT
mgnify:CR=1 FL=1